MEQTALLQPAPVPAWRDPDRRQYFAADAVLAADEAAGLLSRTYVDGSYVTAYDPEHPDRPAATLLRRFARWEGQTFDAAGHRVGVRGGDKLACIHSLRDAIRFLEDAGYRVQYNPKYQ